jgi:hypothetical protein
MPGEPVDFTSTNNQKEIFIGRGPLEFLGDKTVQGLNWFFEKIVQIASSPS